MPDEDHSTQPNDAPEDLAPEARPPYPADPQPVSPISEPSTQSEPAVVARSQNPSRKKFIIGGIIAAILVALLGGGALAYTMYQSPEKVLSDSIVNLAQASGNMSGTGLIEVSNDDVALKIDTSAKSDGTIMNGNAKLSLSFKSEELKSIGAIDAAADYATSNEGVWVKLNDINDVVNKALDAYIDNLKNQYAEMGYDITDEEVESQKSLMHSQIQPIIDKVNNRWIKLDSEDAEKDDEDQCILNALKSATSDKTQRDEVVKAYNANQFILVKEKLGSKDGNIGYKLDFDETKAKAFSKSLKDTTLGKAIVKCDDDAFDDDAVTEESDDLKNGDVEVWIGQWNHKLKRAIITGTADEDNPTSVKIDASFDYDKVTGLSTPKDATTIDELQKEIDSLTGGTTPALEEI